MQVFNLAAVVAVVLALNVDTVAGGRHVHHKKHHHHKHHHKNASAASAEPAHALPATKVFPHSLDGDEPKPNATASETAILEKMKGLTAKLTKEESIPQPPTVGKIEVNGPIPADFAERFIQAAAYAAGVHPGELSVEATQPMGAHGEFAEIAFKGPKDVVLALENQAADPDSRLTHSPIRSFLIARDSDAQEPTHSLISHATSRHSSASSDDEQDEEPAQGSANTENDDESTQDQLGGKGGIDIDTAMPYGELEPFGREDTAQELTESSVKESDEMVDQVERAEAAEEKRAVFRALTRLRGAAITSFDGIARSQTGNIDEYNKVHQWRNTHPLHHLADEESDISKWAFPDNADF